jgi:hypothetical protein
MMVSIHLVHKVVYTACHGTSSESIQTSLVILTMVNLPQWWTKFL